MKGILIFLLTCCVVNAYSQRILSDTCRLLQSQVASNSLPGSVHNNPLCVANGIVIRVEQLDSALLESIIILRCPEAFEKFSYAGLNGVLVIRTKQQFLTVTPKMLRESRGITGSVVYAVNGFYLADSSINVSKDAIQSIEVIKPKGLNLFRRKKKIISIWTISDNERRPLSGLCEGFNWALRDSK